MGSVKRSVWTYDVNNTDAAEGHELFLCVSPGREHGPIIERTGWDSPRMRRLDGSGYTTDPDLQRWGTRFVSDELKAAEIVRELAHLVFAFQTGGLRGPALLKQALRQLPAESALRAEPDAFIEFLAGTSTAVRGRRIEVVELADPASEIEYEFARFWDRYLNSRSVPDFHLSASTATLTNRHRDDDDETQCTDTSEEPIVAELDKWLTLLECDLPLKSHLAAFAEESLHDPAQADKLSYQGCGDLTMNYWSVAFLARDGSVPQIVCPFDEPVEDRTYTCLVKWNEPPAGHRRVEIVAIKLNRYAIAVEEMAWLVDGAAAGAKQPVGELLSLAVSGQPLVLEGRPVPLEFTIEQFPDLRQPFQFPNLNPDDHTVGRQTRLRQLSPRRPRVIFHRPQRDDVWLGEYALLRSRSIRRAALSGPVLLSLDELGTTAEHVEAALYSEGPTSPKHYAEVTHPTRILEPGEFRVVQEGRRRWYDIFFRRAVYPVSVLGITKSGELLSFAWTGPYQHPGGYTIDGLARELAAAPYDVEAAILIDEGSDVFQYHGGTGSLLSPSRTKVRAMFVHAPRRLLGTKPIVRRPAQDTLNQRTSAG